MIIEDNINDRFVFEKHSLPRDAILKIIFKSIEKTAVPFVNTVKLYINKFNEDDFSQEFVEKNDFQLSKLTDCVGVKNQYKDIIYKTKGIPDIYYHFKEEEGVRKPIFIMEAKVLPAPPPIRRQKEYVFGFYKKSGNPSGGIQRFKLEKHGKGQFNCGLLAYVLNDNFDNWIDNINDWIEEFQTNYSFDESLKFITQNEIFYYLKSDVNRINESLLKLHHFWIKLS